MQTSLEETLRGFAPQVLGAVVRRFRDFGAAEDAVQEALIAASAQWPGGGMPDNPRGWLLQIAVRRMTDHQRSEIARRQQESVAAELSPPAAFGAGNEEDDTLVLLFMSCHPALTLPSAIALTLRTVGGLTTAELGNGFLLPEATMAQRISHAKQTIRQSGVPFSLPARAERMERLRAVASWFHSRGRIAHVGIAAVIAEEVALISRTLPKGLISCRRRLLRCTMKR
jgi:predicted RNA polymerase sigma factor